MPSGKFGMKRPIVIIKMEGGASAFNVKVERVP